MNYFKTAILLAALTAIFMAVGYLIGGQTGMVIAFFVALAPNQLRRVGSRLVHTRDHARWRHIQGVADKKQDVHRRRLFIVLQLTDVATIHPGSIREFFLGELRRFSRPAQFLA